MAVPTFRLTSAQADEVTAVSALGSEKLTVVADAVESLGATIKSSTLREAIARASDAEVAPAIQSFLLGIAMVRRRAGATVADLLKGLDAALARIKRSPEQMEQWNSVRPIVERLLSSKSLTTISKAMDLAYDFEDLCIGSRILTDMRPVFDDQRAEIIGTIITQTLRVDYTSQTGTQNTISISMDEKDIEQLKKACESALQKAVNAKKLIQIVCGKETLMPGENSK